MESGRKPGQAFREKELVFERPDAADMKDNRIIRRGLRQGRFYDSARPEPGFLVRTPEPDAVHTIGPAPNRNIGLYRPHFSFERRRDCNNAICQGIRPAHDAATQTVSARISRRGHFAYDRNTLPLRHKQQQRRHPCPPCRVNDVDISQKPGGQLAQKPEILENSGAEPGVFISASCVGRNMIRPRNRSSASLPPLGDDGPSEIGICSLQPAVHAMQTPSRTGMIRRVACCGQENVH